jgi:hypothetical protein
MWVGHPVQPRYDTASPFSLFPTFRGNVVPSSLGIRIASKKYFIPDTFRSKIFPTLSSEVLDIYCRSFYNEKKRFRNSAVRHHIQDIHIPTCSSVSQLRCFTSNSVPVCYTRHVYDSSFYFAGRSLRRRISDVSILGFLSFFRLFGPM